jgi:hypothetical protein
VATNSSKPEQVFPPGFERDTKALLMLREYGVISRAEVRRNVERLGVELVPEPDLVAPPLKPPVTPAPGNVDLVWDDEDPEPDETEDNEE